MTSKCLQVDFWNVGQGDASSILIEESNERIVLDVIDVGRPATSLSPGYARPGARESLYGTSYLPTTTATMSTGLSQSSRRGM